MAPLTHNLIRLDTLIEICTLSDYFFGKRYTASMSTKCTVPVSTTRRRKKLNAFKIGYGH